MRPPMRLRASSTVTRAPSARTRRAAARPATPAPMTTTSALDKALEAAERMIPLFGDQLKILIHLRESPLFQLPNALAPISRAAHQAGAFHHAQVLAHSLPRDGGTAGELCNRHRPVITQAG